MSGRDPDNELMCSKDEAEGFLSFVHTAKQETEIPVDGSTYASPTASRDSQPTKRNGTSKHHHHPLSSKQPPQEYQHDDEEDDDEVEEDDDDENDDNTANNDHEDQDADSTTHSSQSSTAAPPSHGQREAAAAWALATAATAPRNAPRRFDSKGKRTARSLPLSRGRNNKATVATTQPKRSSSLSSSNASMTFPHPLHPHHHPYGPTTAQAAAAARHFLTQPTGAAMAFPASMEQLHHFQRQQQKQQQQMWAAATAAAAHQQEHDFFLSPAVLMADPYRVQHYQAMQQQQQQREDPSNNNYQMPPALIPRQVSSPSVETDSPQHELQVDNANEEMQDHQDHHYEYPNNNNHSYHHQQQQQQLVPPHHPPSPPGGGTTMELATQANAVYFGWIRHPATKTWRDVVKRFSQNRKDFPSWCDDICEQVKTAMRDEKKIDTFYICRRPVVAVNEKPEKKKIFDKNKKNLGTWQVATLQEIMDRTKQRFIDDRKPQAVVVGVKRPRGRPPKNSTLLARELSLDGSGDPRSLTNIISTLQKFMVKWHSDVRRIEMNDTTSSTLEVDNKTTTTESKQDSTIESGKEPTSQPQQPLSISSAPVEPGMCMDVMFQLECTKLMLRKRLEEVLGATAAKANVKSFEAAEEHANEDNEDDQDHDGSTSSTSSPPKKEARVQPESSMRLPKRAPWFPVLSHHVCFDWKHHVGTIKWLDVVKTFSDNATLYPAWEDTIASQIKDKLAVDNCVVYLVFLDSNGKPCESIKDGMWFLATDEEFVERTRLQFLQDRQVPDV